MNFNDTPGFKEAMQRAGTVIEFNHNKAQQKALGNVLLSAKEVEQINFRLAFLEERCDDVAAETASHIKLIINS